MELGKLGCIVQARTTSSRLPGKVLKTIDHKTGKCILSQVIDRLKAVSEIDEIIIATTINDTDDQIVELAEKEGVRAFRGSEDDVLSRFYDAAKLYELDTVIRITSDCPFIDPEVINDLISMYVREEYSYISNGQNRTYPHGLDCEIFSFDALEKADSKGKDKFFREHVTTYIYNHKEEFSIGSLELHNEDYSDIRITVDTESDYIVACIIQDYLSSIKNFSFREIIRLYDEKPFIKLINKDIVQKRQYESKELELQAAVKILKLQELSYAAEIIEEKLKG